MYRFLGFSDNVGDGICFRVLCDDTEQELSRGILRSARDPTRPNLRIGLKIETPITGMPPAGHPQIR